MYLDSILRVFPQAHFIHIKHNPYAVVASWLAMPWAPHNLESILNIIEGLYARLALTKQYLDFRPFHYLEVKLEDLSTNSQKSTDMIFNFLRLKSIAGKHQFKKSIHEARNPHMTAEFKNAVNARLGRFFPLMGYEMEET